MRSLRMNYAYAARRLFPVLAVLLFAFPSFGQQTEISRGRKNVRISGDVLVGMIPAACLASVWLLHDGEGLKQGVFAGATTLGVSYALKYLVDKERPDKSDNHSFPSLHTSVSFTGAAFIQRRYGWQWAIPAYAAASYVGWSRYYGKKHDWWDITAGAALGVGSAWLFTRPFAQKNNLSVCPVAGDRYIGLYASFSF